MDRELSVTEDEIRQRLAEVLGFADIVEDDPDALTVAQLCELFGCSEPTAKKRAEAAVRQGKMKRLKVRRPDSRGRKVIMTVYKLIKGGE